jgi:hypothetical protein
MSGRTAGENVDDSTTTAQDKTSAVHLANISVKSALPSNLKCSQKALATQYYPTTVRQDYDSDTGNAGFLFLYGGANSD